MILCGVTALYQQQVGPLKDFSFFHSGCFKCCVCGSRLSLRTYYHSQHDQDDKEVYCMSHVPKPGPGHLDGSSVGIRAALSVPKSVPIAIFSKASSKFEATMFDPRRENGASPLFDTPSQQQQTPKTRSHNFGRFDASALHIAHALKATELQKAYKKEKPMHYYLVRNVKLLVCKIRKIASAIMPCAKPMLTSKLKGPKEEQTELEMRHRKKRTTYQKFQKQGRKGQINAEFMREGKWGTGEDAHTVSKLRAKEKEDLERHMTIRRDKRH
ncbi:LIM domain-containing protein E [Orchesella cincta]|uniref:LIM domain-containing protein E n=1 Tax=Orchesella cincta TaxID=48709 RepID=A0A1D2MUG7_ORCCI|nr:LIM domain-containing protein E [Orchesella cincta]